MDRTYCGRHYTPGNEKEFGSFQIITARVEQQTSATSSGNERVDACRLPFGLLSYQARYAHDQAY